MSFTAPVGQAGLPPVDRPVAGRATLRGHIAIARPDHWIKNAFVLPGVVVALSIAPDLATPDLLWKVPLALFAIGLVASGNYSLNEVLDARSDVAHPSKSSRPVPSGLVNVPLAYVQWILLVSIGIAIGGVISMPFALALFALFAMGLLYNVPPIRLKDKPYVDVLSESINNPLRLVAGWYITTTTLLPPTSLLISYWMVGAYFMAIKRYAEIRDIGDHARSSAYRKAFGFYTEQRLLVSIMFYASHAMLFFGAFIMRYRLELILAFPLIALVMATYLWLAFKGDSAVQRPERLHREPTLMLIVLACVAVMTLLLFVDVPVLDRIFAPTEAHTRVLNGGRS